MLAPLRINAAHGWGVYDMTVVGANIDEARLEGGMAIEAAEAVGDAILRFREACDNADSASGTDPKIRNWDLFEADEANFMTEAMGYSEVLGENIVHGAEDIGATDLDASEMYRATMVTADLPNINHF